MSETPAREYASAASNSIASPLLSGPPMTYVRLDSRVARPPETTNDFVQVPCSRGWSFVHYADHVGRSIGNFDYLELIDRRVAHTNYSDHQPAVHGRLNSVWARVY